MTKYIINLTNDFIGKYAFDRLFCEISDSHRYIEHVTNQLYASDLCGFQGAALGSILESLEPGELPTNLQFGENVGTDYMKAFRKMISRLLANTIHLRLRKESASADFAYTRKGG